MSAALDPTLTWASCASKQARTLAKHHDTLSIPFICFYLKNANRFLPFRYLYHCEQNLLETLIIVHSLTSVQLWRKGNYKSLTFVHLTTSHTEYWVPSEGEGSQLLSSVVSLPCNDDAILRASSSEVCSLSCKRKKNKKNTYVQ